VLQSALSGNTSEVSARASSRYYRTLSPEAAEYFSSESGRWPENQSWPALRLGPSIGLITTTASMVAFLNSIVAGVGVAMLVGGLLRESRTLLASLIGAGVALLLMALFFIYQKWRYDSAPGDTSVQVGLSGGEGPAE
jgi:hypothetical protein